MTDTTKPNVIQFFPRIKNEEFPPTKTQEVILKAVEKAINGGIKYIIVEAPVGVGKSAIAIALGNWFGDCHIITPRKGLQDQYYEDFAEYSVLMKGRSNYRCTHSLASFDTNCGPSRICEHPTEGKEYWKECQDRDGCPYEIAVANASNSDIIIHNIHSFYYQANLVGKFPPREVLIIDEAHDLEAYIRDLSAQSVQVWKELDSTEVLALHQAVDMSDDRAIMNILGSPECYPIERSGEVFRPAKEWIQEIRKGSFLDIKNIRLAKPLSEYETESVYSEEASSTVEVEVFVDHNSDELCYPIDKYWTESASPTNARRYHEKILDIISMVKEGECILNATSEWHTGLRRNITSLKLVKKDISTAAKHGLFAFGKTVVLMSGTIYSRERFCNGLGISMSESTMLTIPSPFLEDNRQVVYKDEWAIDTSHKAWRDNFPDMMKSINAICEKFPDVKGLIHTPSYHASEQIKDASRGNPRFVFHTSDNFLARLQEFYDDPEPKVFFSPVCQQGVDFKNDRARFQVILRVPFLNVSDPFTSFKCQTDFAWYQYRALIVFGQQLGRVVRNQSDWGYTILLDSRFPAFIRKNKGMIPKWLMNSIKFS